MKLIHFLYKDEKYMGILADDFITPIQSIAGKEVRSLLDLLGEDFNQVSTHDFKLSLDEIKLLPPMEHPIRNAFCLGKNYREHALELRDKIKTEDNIPKKPIYFSKACYNLVTNGDEIDGHFEMTQEVDYEVELALIISKEGKDIKKEEAKDYIFGYTIANDISVRDLQKGHVQWLKGKSLDTHLSIGPLVLKENELLDLRVQSFVNGELRQNSTTSKMIFNIYEIIEDLSKGMTLYPGDIILTGTPEGVGMGFNPPKYLKKGDVIRCEIDKIGSLENTII